MLFAYATGQWHRTLTKKRNRESIGNSATVYDAYAVALRGSSSRAGVRSWKREGLSLFWDSDWLKTHPLHSCHFKRAWSFRVLHNVAYNRIDVFVVSSRVVSCVLYAANFTHHVKRNALRCKGGRAIFRFCDGPHFPSSSPFSPHSSPMGHLRKARRGNIHWRKLLPQMHWWPLLSFHVDVSQEGTLRFT